ncbi:MAG: MBOAT, membrane-bound O-acyltransferase family-domain-containing protein [Benjaminiella poitrasii]|nr:MAG: MBOAT, membrane-bound O-acyltransferase family-domain-containing protein [Benjaminiella poitrasii]
MDSLFIKLSDLLGGQVAPDHLKLAFAILSTYPSALIFKKIQSVSIKHLFSILYTSYIMLFLLKLYDGFIHVSAISILSFSLLKYLKDSYSNIAWINFIFVMLSMSICHIGRQLKGIEGDTQLDYSGAMMIITIKLSSYGFSRMDGYSPRQATTKSTSSISTHAEKMKIVNEPTLLQYFGWVFFFGGFLAGPSCEYMDYIHFVETPTPENQGTSSVPSSSWLPALRRLGKSLIFMAIIVSLGSRFNYFEALKPEWSYLPFWKKVLFIQLSGFLTRCKYYCIWYLSEGACILSGFGFHGLDSKGKPRWDRLNNVNVLDCEFAQSYKQLSENWNIGANHWLRHYVYLRFQQLHPKNSIGTTLKTYIVSSMWHGFHPGFYFFFIIAAILQLMARQVRRTIRPLFISAVDQTPIRYWKAFYDVCTWIASIGFLNMLVPCFDLLYVTRIMYVWRQVYYCHFILMVVGSLLFWVMKPQLLRLQKKRLSAMQQQQEVDSLGVKKRL